MFRFADPASWVLHVHGRLIDAPAGAAPQQQEGGAGGIPAPAMGAQPLTHYLRSARVQLDAARHPDQPAVVLWEAQHHGGAPKEELQLRCARPALPCLVPHVPAQGVVPCVQSSDTSCLLTVGDP